MMSKSFTGHQKLHTHKREPTRVKTMGRLSVIIQECLYTGESILEKGPLNVVKSGRAFSSNRNLIEHKRTHSGEKSSAVRSPLSVMSVETASF